MAQSKRSSIISPSVTSPTSPSSSSSSNSAHNRGAFPSRSPPRSPRQMHASSLASTSSSSNSFNTRGDSPSAALGRGRGTSASGGVQSRRSAVSLGLGVQFAPLLSDLSAPSSRATSPNAANSPSPQRAYSPRPESVQSSSSTRVHSRHGSFSTMNNGMPVASTGGPATRPPSRLPSRRPSLTHLASFLSGIEHHARVRDPGPNGGRGVSRSASRSQSRAGQRRPPGAYGDDYDEDDDEDGAQLRTEENDDDDDDTNSIGGFSSAGLTGRRRASSRASSIRAASRRSSINLGLTSPTTGERGSPHPHPLLHPLVRENTTGGATSPVSMKSPPSSNGGSSGWGRKRDLEEEEDDGSNLGDKTATPTTGQSSYATSRTYQPPMTPRILSTEMDEEPFIDTAPNSPYSINKRNYSFAAIGEHESVDPVVVDDAAGGLSNVEVFEEGERVGVDVWLEGRGGWVRDCFSKDVEGGPGNGIGGPRELEIERRLGEGTYAIVYLVREVLYDPDPNVDDLLSPIDATTSFQFDSVSTSRPRMHSWASDPFSPSPQPTYGKHFALKCLCKKDLTDELIEVQRGEAVLHRALPDHEYIVRLYGAYETDDWLFLVLEYCPGRDLFYWLLESQQDEDGFESRAASPQRRNRLLEDEDPEGTLSRTITANNAADYFDDTPPSPSLLSSTTNSHLLSRKRLRLISRMFAQMCQAVQACHDVGIAHRDIKPENFIVMDGRMDGDGATGSRVVVKITDWGLGTRETECEDFDCGSKPYMAYECRNNLAPSYDPRQADVWSLGLVLLNLLYHRNPWADPSLDDPDFADYVQDGKAFLQHRFEGMSDEVATFLADRVFCDVLEKEADGQYRRRVSAGEFGKWASRLVIMLAGDHKSNGPSGNPFAALTQIQPTNPVEHTFERSVLPQSPVQNERPPAQASLLSQFAPKSMVNSTGGFISTGWSPKLMDDLPTDLPKVIEEPEKELMFSKDESKQSNLAWQPPPLSPRGFSDDESLPSPSFSPPFAPTSLPLPPPTPIAPLSPVNSSMPLPTVPSQPASPLPSPGLDPPKDVAPPPATSPPIEVTTSEHVPLQSPEDTKEGDVRSRSISDEAKEDEEHDRSLGSIDKPKRRKRGARKSRSTRSGQPGDTSPPTPSPLSPASPMSLTIVEESQDQLLQDLASASQNLARELSKAPRSYSAHGTRSPRHTSTSHHQTSSATSLRSNPSSVEVLETAPVPKKPAKSGGVFGRFKTLVTDGNPDLEAFRQRAAERDASIGAKADTYSAPAKMQGGRRHDTPLSSRGSFGTASWGSNWSAEGSEDGQRGRSGTGGRSGIASGEMSPGHWSSTSSRRERLDKQRRQTGEGDLSPSSSSRHGTSTTTTSDSRNHTPLSSFSSINTDASTSTHGTQASQSIATVRDWRTLSPQTSGQERPVYSASRSRHTTSESLRVGGNVKERPTLSPGLPIGDHRPKLVDAATDTADLVTPSSPSPSTTSTTTLAPPPPPRSSPSLPKVSSADAIVRPWSANPKISTPQSSEPARSTTPVVVPAPAAALPPAVPVPVKAPNKLAKMLNSISVFNRTQERPASAGA